MACAKKKFLHAAKLSNSPFQNVEIVLWYHVCIGEHIFHGTICEVCCVLVLWEGEDIFKTSSCARKNQHSNAILSYNPCFSVTSTINGLVFSYKIAKIAYIN